jgi:molecular chaperone DnaK (HSP70)
MAVTGLLHAIDFGTSNSAIVVGKPDDTLTHVPDPALGANSQSVKTSICVLRDGKVVIGKAAENAKALSPAAYRDEFKVDFGDPTPTTLAGRRMTADEMTTEVLRFLREQAQATVPGEPELVVVTVPGLWEAGNMELMRSAVRRAGYGDTDVLLVPEPVAAMAYIFQDYSAQGDEFTTLVYDLGGGTFDCAFAQAIADWYEVLGEPGGLDDVGGALFDRLLLGLIRDRCGDAAARLLAGPAQDTGTLRRRINLKETCEQIKIELSENNHYEGLLTALVPETDFRVDRSDLEALIRPHITETLAECDRLRQRLSLGWKDIDRIAPVGGSSRIPLVGTLIAAHTGRTVLRVRQPEMAVVSGAALIGRKELLGAAPRRLFVNARQRTVSTGEPTSDDILNGGTFAGERDRPDAVTHPGGQKRHGGTGMSMHRVVAAIDFGTHGSGFAWAVVNETNRDMTQREIFYFDNWDAQQVVYPKNLSALLLDKHGNLLEWGYRAQQRMYEEGLIDDRRYETNYKMSLQINTGAAGTLRNLGGSRPTADRTAALITQCIRKVYEKALEHVTAGGAYTADEIAWCITVPAIWEEYTKDLMLKAARSAGLPSDDDRLQLALEPEAAALYCIVKGDKALTVPGCRFLVIDAGGGTVDITSYQVERGPRLSQLATPTGDKAGSEYLNKFFIGDILCDRFGSSFVSALMKRYPREYYELLAAWERAKRGIQVGAQRPVTIPLPAEVYAFAGLEKDAHGRTALANIGARQGGVNTVIVIPATEMRDVFEKAVTAIIAAVTEQLRQMRRSAGTSGGEIALLVGGFAESAYLQSRLRDFLQVEGVTMHVPERPSVAVMTGAAHYAYDPSVIRSRRSPLTYGLKVLFEFREGIDPNSKKKIGDNGFVWCEDRFEGFVVRDEAVETDECRSLRLPPIRADQTDMRIEIFATKAPRAEYTTEAGMGKKADLLVSLEGTMHLQREDRLVETRLYFGDTHIRVEAENVHTGKVQEAKITWQPTW